MEFFVEHFFHTFFLSFVMFLRALYLDPYTIYWLKNIFLCLNFAVHYISSILISVQYVVDSYFFPILLVVLSPLQSFPMLYRSYEIQWSYFSNYGIFSSATRVHFRKSMPMALSSSIFLYIPCTVSKFWVLKYFIGLELVFFLVERYGSNFIFLHEEMQFSWQYFLKRVIFSSVYFWKLYKILSVL